MNPVPMPKTMTPILLKLNIDKENELRMSKNPRILVTGTGMNSQSALLMLGLLAGVLTYARALSMSSHVVLKLMARRGDLETDTD